MQTENETQINPIELIDDVSKNLTKLKELVGMVPKKAKKEKKQSDKPKTEKLPKWVYVKEGYVYKAKVEGGVKTNFKQYILEQLLK
jgi:hypothetical protein